jgi:hypothetical protein
MIINNLYFGEQEEEEEEEEAKEVGCKIYL